MSIASEITRINSTIANAYTACNNKGATIPQTQNSANLAAAISSISTGITPSGNKMLTQNGTYDVTDKASASDKNLLNANKPATGVGSSFAFCNLTGAKLDGRSAEDSNKVEYVRVVCAAASAANMIVTKNEKISPLEE